MPRLYLIPSEQLKNHDILISSIAAAVAGALSAIASIVQFSILFGDSDDEDSPLLSLSVNSDPGTPLGVPCSTDSHTGEAPDRWPIV